MVSRLVFNRFPLVVCRLFTTRCPLGWLGANYRYIRTGLFIGVNSGITKLMPTKTLPLGMVITAIDGIYLRSLAKYPCLDAAKKQHSVFSGFGTRQYPFGRKVRSEERRVGKECRCRRAREHYREKRKN